MAVKNNSLRTAYGQSQGLLAVFNPPIIAVRAPGTSDFAPLGTIWINKSAGTAYVLTQLVANSANWSAAALVGLLNTVTTTNNGAVLFPILNNLNLAGDNVSVRVLGAGNTATVSLVPSPVISGSLSVGTGLSVLAGGATVAGTSTLTSAAATTDALRLVGGGLRVAPVIPAVGLSPRVASGRFGWVAFSNIINAGANLPLVVNNTMATAASHVMATVQCSTVGSACMIRNIDVSVPGSISFNVSNLGGVNTAANIVVAFWLLD